MLPALLAGVFLIAGGFFFPVPKNVTVNGVSVGGKSRTEAARLVREEIGRELQTKQLTVCGRERNYVFTASDIEWTDNLGELLKAVKSGRSYTAQIFCRLKNAEKICAAICAKESMPAVEPFAKFNAEGEPFTYYDGRDGFRANLRQLLSDVSDSLNGGFEDVTVCYFPISCRVSSRQVRYNTRLLSTFTTRYDQSNEARSHNICLAAEKINGTVLRNAEEFSFNRTVGERTALRGFRKAKIIERGEFVEGIGGGVCQASTTLFNAALLSGCEIREVHAHSLAVGYVPPSFDAMVSGSVFDLKFVNRTGYPLYIRARWGEGSVSFDIYGRGDGAEYGYSSVVTAEIPAPVEKTEDASRVKEGRDGIVSEGYLTVTRGGKTQRTLFRRDRYAPVRHIVTEPVVGIDEKKSKNDA